MRIKDVTKYLESLAPLGSQAGYDNCGLLVGDAQTEITETLVCLDCTEDIIDEAIETNCNLVIAHHPIVFSGIKKLNGKNYIERVVIKAIQNNIAIYAIHTNLDSYRFGVNFEIGNRIGLDNLKILQPAKNSLTKVQVYCPTDDAEKVTNAMLLSGAGKIGNYSNCNYQSEGTGGFKPGEGSNPAIGEKNQYERVSETKIEVMVSNHLLGKVLAAMNHAHPYEEVAYDCIPVSNKNEYEGAGMYGELDEPISTLDFLEKIKETFRCGVIRHTKLVKKNIKTVAFCGGSGSFLLQNAKNIKADIYITGDFKYHEFFDAEDDIIIADIGHFESEQYTINLIASLLKKNFANFAVRLTGINTNPINYF